MRSDNHPILGVPTNIITGFLGAGKTSAILNLIANKPENERWAILVNEFGEIGIDGSLFEGQQHDKQQIFIREVAGGCMCCAADLPMQIALNQLLLQAKPDRLLIEPTGLGHPKEVLAVLSSTHYQDVLLLQKNITLVDARQLSDIRYTEHDTFNQQIAIADTVIGNKVDLYQEGDSEKLAAYVEKVGRPNTKVIFSQYGALAFTELDEEGAIKKTSSHNDHHHHEHHHHHNKPLVSELPMPKSGMIKAINKGEGFYSIGWRFSAKKVFDQQKLVMLLAGLQVERVKAAMITSNGFWGYNFSADGLTETALRECSESRIELISDTIDTSFEMKLLSCVID